MRGSACGDKAGVGSIVSCLSGRKRMWVTCYVVSVGKGGRKVVTPWAVGLRLH